MCRQSKSDSLAAIRAIPFQAAEPDVLAEAVGDLVKTVATWRERL